MHSTYDDAIPSQAAPRKRAGRSLQAHLIFWIAGGACLVLDLWSKEWAFSTLGPTEVRRAIPGFLEFRRSLNDGAVFGAFTGQTGLFVAASILAIGFVTYLFATSGARHFGLHMALGMILAGALGNLYDRGFVKADVVRPIRNGTGHRDAFIGVRVGEPIGESIRVGDWPDGTNARTYRLDEIELRRQGVVRDFLKFVPRFPSWVPRLNGRDVWPWVFNVADSALVCGVIVLILFSGRDHRRSEPSA